MNILSTKKARIITTILSLLFLVFLVIADYLFYQQFFRHNYFREIWIENGAFIAFSLTIITLVWGDLDKELPNLVSFHPALYLMDCFKLMTGISVAFLNSIPTFLNKKVISPSQLEKLISNSQLEKLNKVSIKYDYFVSMLIYLILMLVTFIWFLFISPTMYFITLLAGAPSRLAMLAKDNEKVTILNTVDSESGITKDSILLTFVNKPVRLAQALTTGIFLIIKLVENVH